MGTAFLYGNGGGGSGSGGTLTVTAPAGVTVTVSKDGKTKTKVAGSDGIVVFKGLASGSWTVTITDGSQTAQKVAAINTDYAVAIIFSKIPEFTYTGDYEIVNDADEPITASQDNWKIRFLTSGTLNFTNLNGAENGIDVFCVGGGGGGGLGPIGSANGGGGGGGGYTTTEYAKAVSANVDYQIIVGAGGTGCIGSEQVVTSGAGGSSTAFGVTAAGGKGITKAYCGGDGGSGGGGGYGLNGGSDGSDGGTNGTSYPGGSGQGTTTREFGESNGKLYAGGGGGGAPHNASFDAGSGGAGGGADGVKFQNAGISAEANTGGGGGGASRTNNGGNGGSGIVIIRNAREVA